MECLAGPPLPNTNAKFKGQNQRGVQGKTIYSEIQTLARKQHAKVWQVRRMHEADSASGHHQQAAQYVNDSPEDHVEQLPSNIVTLDSLILNSILNDTSLLTCPL